MNSNPVYSEYQLTKLAAELIREHYEPSSEDGFKNVCRKIAKHYEENGDFHLASFIRAQIGDEPSWVPQ